MKRLLCLLGHHHPQGMTYVRDAAWVTEPLCTRCGRLVRR